MAMSMEEYVNAYYGGTLGIAKRYGISKADDPIETTDPAGGFNTMFGAKVYNQLNTKSEVFKLLKKEPWLQSGWRVMTARGTTTAGVAEGGAFPETDHIDLTEVTATLKEVVTPWEMTSKAELLSEADDGLGNLASFMRKENGEVHAYYIDQMLCADTDTVAGNNFESLDRVTMSDAAAHALCNDRADADIYDLDKSATTAWADAHTGHNSDTPTALTLAMLDDAIQSALENGVNYNSLILLTGYDTYQDLKALMRASSNAAFRYDLAPTGAGNMNGVTGEAGLNFDSRVGAYDGIPIFLSQHVASESDATARILLLDMDNLAFRVAAPTTYVDNTNLAIRQNLSREYAFITAGELICYKFATQGSIRDLDQ
tara:strand:+ start:1484 stop:2599 length:1116 start_codon:yes stop_codon:yes gene_type:complete